MYRPKPFPNYKDISEFYITHLYVTIMTNMMVHQLYSLVYFIEWGWLANNNRWRIRLTRLWANICQNYESQNWHEYFEYGMPFVALLYHKIFPQQISKFCSRTGLRSLWSYGRHHSVNFHSLLIRKFGHLHLKGTKTPMNSHFTWLTNRLQYHFPCSYDAHYYSQPQIIGLNTLSRRLFF